MKNKIIAFLLAVFTLVPLLCACVSVEVFDDYPMYCRADVELMAESDSFGNGRSDDVYVALDYLYNYSEAAEICGDSFEVDDEDVVCLLSEGDTSGFKGSFEGSAEYSVTVDDTVFNIKLEKEFDGVWTVTDFEKE